MEIVRQIIDSSLLDKINLPESLKNRKVEITILPFSEININNDFIEEKKGRHTIESIAGMGHKYAKKDMTIDEIMEMESNAWAEAAVEKHRKNFKNLKLK